ncbi:unnamed protein product [Calypogeia fissa]
MANRVNRVNRVAVFAIAVLYIFQCISLPALCQQQHSADFDSDDFSDEQDCLYEGKDACNRADLLGCVWCDLPRRCYTAARSLKLGAFCNSPTGTERAPMADCDAVRGEAECSAKAECRWCWSQELDDGCFSAREAVRLPAEIFSCPDKNLHLPASSKNSLS